MAEATQSKGPKVLEVTRKEVQKRMVSVAAVPSYESDGWKKVGLSKSGNSAEMEKTVEITEKFAVQSSWVNKNDVANYKSHGWKETKEEDKEKNLVKLELHTKIA